MPPKTLKQCLREGTTLLQPPNPLPTAPDELARRLGIELTPDHDTAGLRLLIGIRCLEWLVDIQTWVEKEYWPIEHREGLGPSDFLLGTADLRLIRTLCQHTIDSLLLPLCIEFHKTAAKVTAESQQDLKNTITTLLGLMNTSQPPTTSAGPSTRPNYPPTVIGQILTIKHLPCIYLSATLLTYAPTLPGPVHQDLRTTLLQSWQRLAPTVVISAIGTAIRLSTSKGDETGSEGWNRSWPTYVSNKLGWQMSAVVRRPGGIRAIMENVFGENAVLQGGRGVDTEKLDMIARAVISSSTGPTTQWVPQTLNALLDIILPPNGSSSPQLFINAACYTVHRIWTLHEKETTHHLDSILRNPLEAWTEQVETQDPRPELQRAIQYISALSIHTPFSPDFLDYLIGQNLSLLLSLRQDLTELDAPIEISTSSAQPPGENSIAASSETIHQILLSWTRDVGLEDGVRRVIEAKQSDRAEVQYLTKIIAEAERPELANAVDQASLGTSKRGEGHTENGGSSVSPESLPALMRDRLGVDDIDPPDTTHRSLDGEPELQP